MKTDVTPALARVATTTLEELGFFFVDPEPDAEQAAAPLEAGARVRFSGPLAGTLEIRLAGGLLPSLAANMLGALEPPPPALQRDALGEVANVICGNLLPALADAVFDLAPPEVFDAAAPPDSPAGTLAAHARVGVEGGHADLALYLVPP